MYKKIIAIAMAATLAASVPVFADVQTPAVNTGATESQTAAVSAGVKPDIPLYILDRLVEKIQIALISDAVKEEIKDNYKEKADLEKLVQKPAEEDKDDGDNAKIAENGKDGEKIEKAAEKAVEKLKSKSQNQKRTMRRSLRRG